MLLPQRKSLDSEIEVKVRKPLLYKVVRKDIFVTFEQRREWKSADKPRVKG